MTRRQLKVKKLQGTPYAIDEQHVIGKGSFAKIVKAYNTQDLKEQLCAKVISFKDEETSQTIKSQLQMLKQLPYHPNLVNCVKIQISSQRNFYLIMEFCNEGNLAQYLYRNKYQMSEERIWFFLKQFCDGYKVLYDANIIHRDLKPENVLIHNGNFKIADFGLARFINDREVLENISSKGTPLFMAPEISISREGNSKVDVFSLGVLLYKMAFNGKHPYFEEKRSYRAVKDYFKELMLKRLLFPPKHNRSVELVDLITRMLEKQNQKRICWKQIFEMQKISKAVRFERRRQILPMPQFNKSLIIANKSITKVSIMQAEKQDLASKDNINGQQTNIIIEETFNRPQKTPIEQKLYHHKLLYTLIEYTNKKIISFMEEMAKQEEEIKAKKGKNSGKQSPKIFGHLRKQLKRAVTHGLKFSLFAIGNLEDISGDWSTINHGQIMNFEDIFESDKEILLEQLKKFLMKEKSQEESQFLIKKGYAVGQYENTLYIFLTEFNEYPCQLRDKLRVLAALLTDVYDLVLKYQEKHIEDEPKSKFEEMEGQGVDQFHSYLIKLQYTSEQQLLKSMKQKGLLFL